MKKSSSLTSFASVLLISFTIIGWVNPTRTVRIYDIPFDSLRIISQPVWGPQTDCSIAYPTSLVTADTLFQYLGGIYDINAKNAQPSVLLNDLYTERDELLDEINYHFYEVAGLDIAEKRMGSSGAGEFRLFKGMFTAPSVTAADRAKLLAASPAVRAALERSRYTDEVYNVTATATINKAFTASIAAQATIPFQKFTKLGLNARAKASIERLVDLTSTASNLKFHIIRLHPNYIIIARRVMQPYEAPAKFESLPNTSFSEDLRNFLPSDSKAIVVGSGVFEGAFATTTSKDVFVRKLNAELKTILPKIDAPNDTAGFANAVLAAGFNRTQAIGVSSNHKYWYISFARMKTLELQLRQPNGRPFQPCAD